MTDDLTTGDLELEERGALRRIAGLSTELQDISEVEYRQVRLERVVLVGGWTDGTAADADALRDLTGERLAEVVVDATGSHHSMAAALGFCSFGGRLVYVGITQQELSFLHAPV